MGRSSSVQNPFKNEITNTWMNYVMIVFLSCAIVMICFGDVFQMNVEISERLLAFNHHIFLDASSSSTTKDVAMAEGSEPLMEDDFPDLSISEYLEWLHFYYENLHFSPIPENKIKSRRINRSILTDSMRLGCMNLISNMQREGNFNYQYNFVTKQFLDGGLPAHQAAALWGLSLCLQHDPTNELLKQAVEKGISFYTKRTANGRGRTKFVEYLRNDNESDTGTNALLGLALIEYLRTVKEHSVASRDVKDIENLLRSVIDFLAYNQNDDLRFAKEYSIRQKNMRTHSNSPKHDGEIMLCLMKAAKYLDGYEDLIPVIEKAAPVMAKEYSLDAWRENHDSDKTNRFYQWGSMFFTEYYEAQYANYEIFGDYVVVLGHWVIEIHDVLVRRKNAGYAFEGIICAYHVAQGRGNQDAMNKFKYAIDTGLYKLTQLQVGGPLEHENDYLVRHEVHQDDFATGGVMSSREDPNIRIDITQHQMNALIMALSTVYNKKS
jgi:hypothetical protein